jgi:hypothetical protein
MVYIRRIGVGGIEGAMLTGEEQNFGMTMPGWYDIAHLGHDVSYQREVMSFDESY